MKWGAGQRKRAAVAIDWREGMRGWMAVNALGTKGREQVAVALQGWMRQDATAAEQRKRQK